MQPSASAKAKDVTTTLFRPRPLGLTINEMIDGENIIYVVWTAGHRSARKGQARLVGIFDQYLEACAVKASVNGGDLKKYDNIDAVFVGENKFLNKLKHEFDQRIR